MSGSLDAVHADTPADLAAGEAPRTVGGWLDALQPPPPPALAARLRELLAAVCERPAQEVPDVCLAAGEALLDSLLATGSTSRASALDLLAADALVTYAFEAAADDPERLEARAASAMARIAAIPSGRSA